MHPSPKAAGPTAVVTVLPPAGREEQLERWGLNPSAHWPEVDRWGHGPDDVADVSAGDGDAAWDDPEQAARELEERGFLVDGGWHVATVTEGGGRDGGMTSHRGVTHPDEYVDQAALQAMVERELGFTYEQVRSVYRQGPLSADQRELRGKIDARLLALSRAGGTMLELARAFGWKIEEARDEGGETCWTLKKALNRARAAESVAA